MLKAMAFLNLSTKNSNCGRKNYLAMIRSRSVNKFLFSVSYETHFSVFLIKRRPPILVLLSCVEIGDMFIFDWFPWIRLEIIAQSLFSGYCWEKWVRSEWEVYNSRPRFEFLVDKLKKAIAFRIITTLKTKKHFQLCLAPIETPHRGTYL